jgi:hypothetical protein
MLKGTPLRLQGAMTERFFLPTAAQTASASGTIPRDVQQ